jgi:predicted transcriptional regulator
MSDETITIRVEGRDAFFDRVAEKLERVSDQEDVGERHVVSLPDEESLERVLSEQNLELIRTIAATEPDSIRELAREVDRDIKNVSEAVTELVELGLVETTKEGRAKRPHVWYNTIEVEYQVQPIDGDADIATP